MKIISANFNKHISDIMRIKNTKSIPDGTYQIMETGDSVDLFYDIHKFVVIEANVDEDAEISNVYTPAEEKIEILTDAYIKLSMEMMNEGWEFSEDEDFEGMNLLPIMQKIKTLKMLQALTNPDIMEANMDAMGGQYA